MNADKDRLIKTLNKLQHAVRKGDKNKANNIIFWFHQNLARNKQILTDIYTSSCRCTTQTDLIVAACQNKQADILYYLLNETDILVHLTDDSFDKAEVNKLKTEAFQHALRLDAFNMVEMLYDYWCGNLHWIGHDLNNIEMVGGVLKSAAITCPYTDITLVNKLYSLIRLNDFQREVYIKLAELKPSDNAPKETATMMLNVLRIYDKYSHFDTLRGTSRPVEEHQQQLKADIENKSSLYWRSFGYIVYEVYYRKLDFNMSLLILENFNIIKKHLKNRFNKTEKYFMDNPRLKIFYTRAAEAYKEFESEIYHFIYRTGEDWRLYSPGKKEITVINERTNHTAHEVAKNIVKVTFDMNKYDSGPVRYFERKSFRRNLKKFAKILRIHVIRRDPALVGSGAGVAQPKNKINMKVVPLLDENYLQTTRYMRDQYSLFKIIYYIEAVENRNYINVLMIERVLHVIGEMLKSTDDSNHLSRSTLALLQIAMSVETVRHLHNIRDFLSKANKGQVSTRIDIAHTQALTLFVKIKQELIIIKKIIFSVLDIQQCILDKSLLQKGYSLLERRIRVLPAEALAHVEELCRLKLHIFDLVSEDSLRFHREVWQPTGLSDLLLKEIPWIEENKDEIFSNIQLAKTRLSDYVVIILPSFIQNVRRILECIKENNNHVKRINEQLSNYDKNATMPEFPDSDEINRTQNKAARLMKRNQKVVIDLKLLSQIKNYKLHWNSIKDMINFCLTECDLFAPISHFNLNEDSLPDVTNVNRVYNMLTELETVCKTRRSNLGWWQKMYSLFKNWKHWKVLRSTDFTGIEKLIGVITTAEEVKSKNPRLAREELMLCLIKRLDQLKQTLLYPQRISLKQQVQRFNHDMDYRITLEMILADIANVLVVCKIRLMNKSSKLLREIDLGNVLDHGNPFLEVIGYIFKSHDFAAELLDKAMMFVEDGESIEALYELFKGNVNYETIKAGDLLKMDSTQQKLYEQFKKSPNWESYAKLTRYPNTKQNNTAKQHDT